MMPKSSVTGVVMTDMVAAVVREKQGGSGEGEGRVYVVVGE